MSQASQATEITISRPANPSSVKFLATCLTCGHVREVEVPITFQDVEFETDCLGPGKTCKLMRFDRQKEIVCYYGSKRRLHRRIDADAIEAVTKSEV